LSAGCQRPLAILIFLSTYRALRSSNGGGRLAFIHGKIAANRRRASKERRATAQSVYDVVIDGNNEHLRRSMVTQQAEQSQTVSE
jgi:hypothetical protein